MERFLEFISNHWIMAGAAVVVAVLLIQDLIESLLRRHRLASPGETIALMNDENAVILDVREPHEYAEGHIENARNIPLGKLEERIHEIESAKSSPVIVLCQSGTRTAQACKTLTKQGFAQVYEMRGGMVAWEEQKLPIRRKRSKK